MSFVFTWFVTLFTRTVLSLWWVLQVQLDGIGAAISNLQYFHRSIDKTYTTLEVSASSLYATSKYRVKHSNC
jgi:hypothetical protein